jgi:hypothetical protein
MKALVLKSKVVQVVNDGEEFPVHSSMEWVDCEGNVSPGWVRIDNIIQEDPKDIERRALENSDEYKRKQEMPSLEEKIDALLEAVMNNNDVELFALKARIDSINSKYPKDK